VDSKLEEVEGKLRKEIDAIGIAIWHHSAEIEDEDEVFARIKQAFKEEGWIEPRQPVEGELAADLCRYCWDIHGCSTFLNMNKTAREDCHRFKMLRRLAEAQLAHDKQRMENQGWMLKEDGWVKLPSEDELAERLTKVGEMTGMLLELDNDPLYWARELLELLKRD